MKPTLEAIARLYASVLGDDPAPESRAWLHWFVRQHPELSKLWAQLEAPTDAGISLLDLAALVLAAGVMQRFPEGGPLLDEVLGLDDQTRALRDRLAAMADDLGRDRLHDDLWATEALRAHRLFDQLVSNLHAADPVETLDPGDFRGVPYEQLVAVCDARLRDLASGPHEPGKPSRDELQALRGVLVRHLRGEKAVAGVAERIGQLEAWLDGYQPEADLADWLEQAAADVRIFHRSGEK